MTGGRDGPDPPRIRLLGPLEVRIGGRPVPLGGRQPRALFALLALQPGVGLRMPELIGELWDSRPPAGATNTVQVYVSRLRRALAGAGPGSAADPGPPIVLRAHQNGYLLDAAPAATDTGCFEQLVSAGHQAIGRGDLEAASRHWRAALALWRGPALPDLTGQVGEARRAGLEAQRMRTLANRMDVDAALGHQDAIIPELRQLVQEHPFDERLTGQLMRALYVAGQQAESLAVYQQAAARLADELGVDPGPELRQLHTDVLRQEASLSTAPRPARLIPGTRIPAQGRPRPRTELIGRHDEIAEVMSLLSSGQIRLLTVVGPGGAGKTRLALEATAALVQELGAGVPFLQLESAADPAELLPRLSQALNAAPSWPGQPLIELIAAALGQGPRVVVLDNLEALIHAGAGPELVQLLDAAPELSVLSTSRAPLRLRGERLLDLRPLSLPDPAGDHDPAHVLSSGSVQLFLARAQSVMPEFAVTSQNCAAVAQVCRMLDGLPLAIELAAARIRLLPPAQMLRRVGTRLELLTGGATDLPERQRSMRAVLESSVQLLSEGETQLFAALSVFSGGWTLTDAEAVLGPGRGGTYAGQLVLDGLDRLVDRSLVVADGSGRFSMLGMVREYAAELLAQQDGAAAAAQRAHAEHFAGRAMELAPDVGRHPDSAYRGWPGQESANLEAALSHAARQADGTLLARLMTGLLDHWFYSGRIDQADRWIRMTDATRLDPAARAHLLLSAGNLALVSGDLSRAGPMLADAHAAAVAADDPGLTARTLAAGSVVARHQGRPGDALRLVDQALDAAQATGAAALTIRLGNERGELLDEIGRPGLAEPLFAAFRNWSRSEQATSNEALAIANLALLATEREDPDQARRLVSEALDAVARGDSVPLRGDVLHIAGLVQLRLSDPARASQALRAAAPLMSAAGQLLTLPDTVALLAVASLDLGHPVTAARLFGVSESWRTARGLAIAGRQARAEIARAKRQLAGRLRDPASRERETAAGAIVPFADLARIAHAVEWNGIWIADLRTRPGQALPSQERLSGSRSPNSISSGGSSPAGLNP